MLPYYPLNYSTVCFRVFVFVLICECVCLCVFVSSLSQINPFSNHLEFNVFCRQQQPAALCVFVWVSLLDLYGCLFVCVCVYFCGMLTICEWCFISFAFCVVESCVIFFKFNILSPSTVVCVSLSLCLGLLPGCFIVSLCVYTVEISSF